MPIRMSLHQRRRIDDLLFVKRPANELNSYRQFFGIKATRNAHCRQTAKVSDPAERIGKVQIGFQVGA